MMRIGIAADHGGFALKEELTESLRGSGHEVADFGAYQLTHGDDYPDFIIPLARAVAAKEDVPAWRSAAAASERRLLQTRFPVCAPGSFMMFSPPVKASKMTI